MQGHQNLQARLITQRAQSHEDPTRWPKIAFSDRFNSLFKLTLVFCLCFFGILPLAIADEENSPSCHRSLDSQKRESRQKNNQAPQSWEIPLRKRLETLNEEQSTTEIENELVKLFKETLSIYKKVHRGLTLSSSPGGIEVFSSNFIESLFLKMANQIRFFKISNKLFVLSNIDDIKFTNKKSLLAVKAQFLNHLLGSIQFGELRAPLRPRTIGTLVHHLRNLDTTNALEIKSFILRRLLEPIEEGPVLMARLNGPGIIALVHAFSNGRLSYTEDHLSALLNELQYRCERGDRLILDLPIKELSSLLLRLRPYQERIPPVIYHDIQRALQSTRRADGAPRIAFADKFALSVVISELFIKNHHLLETFVDFIVHFFMTEKINDQSIVNEISARDTAHLLVALSKYTLKSYPEFIDHLASELTRPLAQDGRSRLHSFDDRSFYDILYALQLLNHPVDETAKTRILNHARDRIESSNLLDDRLFFANRLPIILTSLATRGIDINLIFTQKLEADFLTNGHHKYPKNSFYERRNLLRFSVLMHEWNYRPSSQYINAWKRAMNEPWRGELSDINFSDLIGFFHLVKTEFYHEFYDDHLLSQLVPLAFKKLEEAKSKQISLPPRYLAVFLTVINKLHSYTIPDSTIETWMDLTLRTMPDGSLYIDHFPDRYLGAALTHLSLVLGEKRSSPRLQEWLNHWTELATKPSAQHIEAPLARFDNQNFTNSLTAYLKLSSEHPSLIMKRWENFLIEDKSKDPASPKRISNFNEKDLANLLSAYASLRTPPPPNILNSWYDAFLKKGDDGNYVLQDFDMDLTAAIRNSFTSLEAMPPAEVLYRLEEFTKKILKRRTSGSEYRSCLSTFYFISYRRHRISSSSLRLLTDGFHQHKNDPDFNGISLHLFVKIVSLQSHLFDQKTMDSIIETLMKIGIDDYGTDPLILTPKALSQIDHDYAYQFYLKFKPAILYHLKSDNLRFEVLHSFYLFYQYQILVKRQSFPEIEKRVFNSMLMIIKHENQDRILSINSHQLELSQEIISRFEPHLFIQEAYIEEIAGYVDLYEPNQKLVIQIDGDHHYLSNKFTGELVLRAKDIMQDEILMAAGYKVQRISYSDWTNKVKKQNLIHLIGQKLE